MKKEKPGSSKTNPKTRISHTRKPKGMTDLAWQTALREQFAAEKFFHIQKIEPGGIYGDYHVRSDGSRISYKVALRSADNTLNYCSCPDFKTNQLGTCKHIEAVLLKIKSKPATKRLLSKPYTPYYTSVFLDYRGERKVKIRIGTENTDEFRKATRSYFNENLELTENAFLKFEKFLAKAYAIHPDFRCYDDAMEFILWERNRKHRAQVIEEKGISMLDGMSKKKLFPYQQKGVLFCAKAGKSILADDMGLGKTLQSIICTEVWRKHFKADKALIICPTSLKYQWKTEIEKFTGNRNVCVVDGNILDRKNIYSNNSFDYLIISYQMAANDAWYLNDMKADVLILDEAQRIKNWKTKTSSAIKRINTPYALVLTGTPIENKIEDLYSLMQIVNPYMLGSLHRFLSRHEIKDDDTGKVVGYKDLNTIGELLKPVMLRRTKKEVLKELPARLDKNLFVPLTKEQIELHTEYGQHISKLVRKWKRFGFLTEEDRNQLLKLLNMMRMVCNSTYIIDQKTNFQTKLDELQNILDEIIDLPGEKVVIFSQWERMTRLVAAILREKNIGFEYLHGGVPGKDRGRLYENFTQKDNCRVFLSTDAGGVGLNLQSAAYIVNLDLPWNPAVLEQRIGRIYRLGQKKNVSVINLVSQGSIEHRMLSVLKFKKGVAAGILDGGDSDIFMGEDRFKEFMKTVESVTSDAVGETIPQDTAMERDTEKQLAEQPKKGSTPLEISELLVNDDSDLTGETTNQNEKAVQFTKEENVIQQGTVFLQGLLQVLSSPESTEKLVSSITEKDNKTGQTYLKLPIGNSEVLTGVLKTLGGLFAGLNQKQH